MRTCEVRILLIAPPSVYEIASGKTLSNIIQEASSLVNFFRPKPVISSEIQSMAQPTLGLAYIASVLENAGYYVSILEMGTSEIGLEELKNYVTENAPNIVGITSLTANFPFAGKIAQEVKNVNPNILVVMGGPHVTFTAERTLDQNSSIDVVVRGEGEFTMLDIVQRFAEGESLDEIKGITIRKDGKIISYPPRPLVENLDHIPFPARHLLNLERVHTINMISSRGCPYNCVFCACPAIFNRKYRTRSPEDIIAELEHVIYSYAIRNIDFNDDLFTISKERVREICRLISSRNLRIEWACESRVDTIDRELMKTMREAGCTKLHFGVESGSQEILNRINKQISPQQVVKAINMANELGIDTIVSFIFGLPGESMETAAETIRFAEGLGATEVFFFALQPFPGTALYEKSDEYKIKFLSRKPEDLATGRSLVETQYLTPEEIDRICRSTSLKFRLDLV